MHCSQTLCLAPALSPPMSRSAELRLGSRLIGGSCRDGARRSVFTRFEFRELFLRPAVNPRRGIFFAQPAKGGDGFVGLAAAQETVGLLELFFADCERARH